MPRRKKEAPPEQPQYAVTTQKTTVPQDPAPLPANPQQTLTEEEFEARIADMRKMRDMAKTTPFVPPSAPSAPPAPTTTPIQFAPPAPAMQFSTGFPGLGAMPAAPTIMQMPQAPAQVPAPAPAPAPAFAAPQPQAAEPQRPAPLGTRISGPPMQAPQFQRPTAPVAPQMPAPAPVVAPTQHLAVSAPASAEIVEVQPHEYAIISGSDRAAKAIRTNLAGGFDFNEFQLPRIKVPRGGGMAYEISTPEGIVAAPEFWGVIIECHDQRSYWKDPIETTGGHNPPDCTSDDGLIGRGNPGGNCASCPFNQWGSRALLRPQDGNCKGKACRQVTMVFIVQPGQMFPSLLSAPPTSIGLLHRYMMNLSTRCQVYYGVETKFGLQQQQFGGFTVAVINPSRSRSLTQSQEATVEQARASMMALFRQVTLTQADAETDGGA